MINQFTYSLYLRKSKRNVKGESAIYLKIETNNGQVIRKGTGLYVKSSYWDKEKAFVSRNYSQYRDIAFSLDKIIDELDKKSREMILKGWKMNLTTFKSYLKNETSGEPTFISFFENRIEESKQLSYQDSTIRVYQYCLNLLRKCFEKEGWNFKLGISDFSYDHIIGFEKFLISERGASKNTINKYQKTVKAILNEALKKEVINKNPFINYKISWKQSKREVLTLNEIKAIQNKSFKIPRIEEVKRLFLFSCFTGLSYIDLKELRIKNIQQDQDGNHFLSFKRKKPNTLCIVPLIGFANRTIKEVLSENKNKNEKVFDVITNQKLNSYLKEIADLTGITKNVTFHMARHTFATTVCLESGIDIVNIKSMMGHSKLSTTMIYTHNSESRVLNSRKRLEKHFSE